MKEGNFSAALEQLLKQVKEGKLSKEEILGNWDRTRGRDWYTGTSPYSFTRGS